MPEPAITINGRALSTAEAMTTELEPEQVVDANHVLANYLNNALSKWEEAVKMMEKGDFSYEEGPPPSPGFLSYDALFQHTRKLIEQLNSPLVKEPPRTRAPRPDGLPFDPGDKVKVDWRDVQFEGHVLGYHACPSGCVRVVQGADDEWIVPFENVMRI